MFRKRRRYVFRKRSIRSRIFWPLTGALILVMIGLIWFTPWTELSTADVDAPKVENLEDQPGQDQTKYQQPEQAATNDQPEKETIKDRPKDEEALEYTPPLPAPSSLGATQGVSSNPLPPAPPALPPSSPAPVEEVAKNFLLSNDYWHSNPGYWDYEPDYWHYEPGY